MKKRSKILAGIVLLLSMLSGQNAFAQTADKDTANWPDKPIRIVVAFAAGGITDILARLIAQRLSEVYNYQIVVENKPGGGANVAADIVAKSKPDGFTWLFANPSPYSINQFIYSSLSYSPDDLVGIVAAAETPNVLLVTKDLPVKTATELVAYAKANPGKLTYGSGGIGSTGHLSSELFKVITGIDALHVPYKGSAPMTIDLVAGRIQMAVDNIPTHLDSIRAGNVRALAVASERRALTLPDVPTAKEAGIDGFISSAWYAFAVPKGTSNAVIEKINRDVRSVLAEPATAERVKQIGGEIIAASVADTQAFFKSEAKKWELVAQKGSVRAE